MLNSDNAADRYTANGITTNFTYNFRILTKNDIEVSVNDVVKTVDTDYTVSGVGASGGGTVTFLTAPADTTIVSLLRKQTLEQQSNYTPNESFPSERIEQDLDKALMVCQQLQEAISRALKYKKSSSLVDQYIDTPVEGKFARAKVGGGIDWATVTSAGMLSDPVPIANGGTGATTAATARTALDVPSNAEAILDTLVDAKGDLVTATGNDLPARLAVGIDNSILVADSAQATGLKWLRGQIPFPATQNASADANTLDDYEEGTWTPVLTFNTAGNLSVAYAVQAGTYTKIGKRVFLSFNIQTSSFTHTTASGSLQLTGIPFPTAGAQSWWEGAVGFSGVTKASYTQVVPEIVGAGSTIIFQASGSGQSMATVTATDVPTGGTVHLRGQISYDAQN